MNTDTPIQMPQQTEPFVVPAGDGPFIELGDHRANIKVSAQNAGGAFILLDTEVDPGGNVLPHVHTREDETFYILEGRFAFLVGDRAITAGPGDTVFAPRNLAHTWRCIGPELGRVLVLISPGENFEAFGIAMAQRGFVPSAAMADPAARTQFMALARQYGIEMLPSIK